MRKYFIEKLTKLAEQDPDIYLLTGDLGFSVLEIFRDKFPDRFINVGISEQSMIGVASGLALAGKNVFVYSITPFITMRVFEQIRVDLCYQNLPVKLLGAGAGLDYAQAATTHYAIEDIAIMKSLPNMTIFAPSTEQELDNLIYKSLDIKGPVYFRLTKKVNIQENFKRTGNYLIFTTSNSLELGYKVYKNLSNLGLDIGLVNLSIIKPLDERYLLNIKDKTKAIFVIEEHNKIGGLGESIASFIIQNFDNNIKFKIFGIPDTYFHEIGSSNYLKEKIGLTEQNISNEILNILNVKELTNFYCNKQDKLCV